MPPFLPIFTEKAIDGLKKAKEKFSVSTLSPKFKRRKQHKFIEKNYGELLKLEAGFNRFSLSVQEKDDKPTLKDDRQNILTASKQAQPLEKDKYTKLNDAYDDAIAEVNDFFDKLEPHNKLYKHLAILQQYVNKLEDSLGRLEDRPSKYDKLRTRRTRKKDLSKADETHLARLKKVLAMAQDKCKYNIIEDKQYDLTSELQEIQRLLDAHNEELNASAFCKGQIGECKRNQRENGYSAPTIPPSNTSCPLSNAILKLQSESQQISWRKRSGKYKSKILPKMSPRKTGKKKALSAILEGLQALENLEIAPGLVVEHIKDIKQQFDDEFRNKTTPSGKLKYQAISDEWDDLENTLEHYQQRYLEQINKIADLQRERELSHNDDATAIIDNAAMKLTRYLQTGDQTAIADFGYELNFDPNNITLNATHWQQTTSSLQTQRTPPNLAQAGLVRLASPMVGPMMAALHPQHRFINNAAAAGSPQPHWHHTQGNPSFPATASQFRTHGAAAMSPLATHQRQYRAMTASSPQVQQLFSSILNDNNNPGFIDHYKKQFKDQGLLTNDKTVLMEKINNYVRVYQASLNHNQISNLNSLAEELKRVTTQYESANLTQRR